MPGAHERITGRLPHYDQRKPGIAAFLQPGADAVDELDAVLEAVRTSLYLPTASGQALEGFAARWGLSRNPGELDGQLRERIRYEIMLCLSSATLEEVKYGLARYMGWDPNAIKISSNWSPTLREEYPAFFEVRIPMSWLPKTEQENFRFSEHPTESTFESPFGFNRGGLRWPIAGQWVDYPLTAEQFLDRMAAVGVKFLLSIYGGFRFSLNPVESTFDSEYGFDRGGLVGILRR